MHKLLLRMRCDQDVPLLYLPIKSIAHWQVGLLQCCSSTAGGNSWQQRASQVQTAVSGSLMIVSSPLSTDSCLQLSTISGMLVQRTYTSLLRMMMMSSKTLHPVAATEVCLLAPSSAGVLLRQQRCHCLVSAQSPWPLQVSAFVHF